MKKNRMPECRNGEEAPQTLFGLHLVRENLMNIDLPLSLTVQAIHCPVHLPGGVCYATGSYLFTGDVLVYRTVGRTDTQYGSREDQIRSVRKLYALFPASMKIYAGQRRLTDIGSEKNDNSRITIDGGSWLEKQ